MIIDNIGDYLYLRNGSFKFEVDPHQFSAKWLIMLGFMDLRKPMDARRSNVGLSLWWKMEKPSSLNKQT